MYNKPIRTGVAKPALALHGSDLAPVIHFDQAPYFGMLNGTGRITLTTQVMSQCDKDGRLISDHRVTAHLCGSIQAMKDLRSMIDKILLLASTTEDVLN